MLKTPLTINNKEVIIGIGLSIGILVLFTVNIVFFVPAIREVTSPTPKTQTQELIDKQSVNQALQLLSGEK